MATEPGSSSLFSLENAIASATRMNETLNVVNVGSHRSKRGTKKQTNNKENSSSLNHTARNASMKLSMSSNSSSLGVVAQASSSSLLLPSKGRKTPSKTPKKSPSRGCRTPNAADRFIANRNAVDFDTSAFRLTRGDLFDPQPELLSPSKRDFQNAISETLLGASTQELNKTRIVSYALKPPTAPENHDNGLKVLYSKTPGSTAKKKNRHIPQDPERILDAPEMVNDYYLNLIDWSATNQLAVALGGCVFLWNATDGSIKQLMELESAEDYVCSLKFIKQGGHLAVANSEGDVGLWDVEQCKRIRLMQGHSDRVSSLSWNEYVLSSGSRSGHIHHSDVRIANHLVSSVEAHSHEVCGLAWSVDGRLLASGGNDNVLNIWGANGGPVPDAAPKYSFNDHQAAVKALAWCPWQPSVLASGGGTADRTIKLWNCNNGSRLHSVDTQSQVCSLVWAPEYKELVSAHGYRKNEVTIWKYPGMVKVAELMGHTERVLHLALSPDGSTLVSAAGDETLRLWKCFVADGSKKKTNDNAKTKGSSLFARAGIR